MIIIIRTGQGRSDYLMVRFQNGNCRCIELKLSETSSQLVFGRLCRPEGRAAPSYNEYSFFGIATEADKAHAIGLEEEHKEGVKVIRDNTWTHMMTYLYFIQIAKNNKCLCAVRARNRRM